MLKKLKQQKSYSYSSSIQIALLIFSISVCSDPTYVDRTVARGDVEAVEILEGVYRSLSEEWPQNWADCVSWARKQWETLYNNHVRQLLHCFPPDQVMYCTHFTVKYTIVQHSG